MTTNKRYQRRKVATTIYITPEQDAALRELSQRTRVSVAEYVRDGIDSVLARHAPRAEVAA